MNFRFSTGWLARTLVRELARASVVGAVAVARIAATRAGAAALRVLAWVAS